MSDITIKEAREAAERVQRVVGTWTQESKDRLPDVQRDIMESWQKDLQIIVNYTLSTTNATEAMQASQASQAELAK